MGSRPPKRIRTKYTIDHWTFGRIFTRKGLHNPREAGESRPNAWFASLRESVWADLEERGSLPELEIDEILDWADAYYARAGKWPAHSSGPIPEAPGETWLAVEAALTYGLRGLPGGWTLLRLFAAHRGVYNPRDPHFTIQQILAWADAWQARTGQWPMGSSGDIPDSDGINWVIVDHALRKGMPGLPGGSSIARLLAQKRGVPNEKDLPPFRISEILGWADAYHARHNKWPKPNSGVIPEAPRETWLKVQTALNSGVRGLPGGSTLARLLAARRGVRNLGDLAPLSEEQILDWADAFHSRTGRRPTNRSGPIPEAPGENWQAMENALVKGMRGLPGGSSIARFLFEHRGVRDRRFSTSLTFAQILRWAAGCAGNDVQPPRPACPNKVSARPTCEYSRNTVWSATPYWNTNAPRPSDRNNQNAGQTTDKRPNVLYRQMVYKKIQCSAGVSTSNRESSPRGGLHPCCSQTGPIRRTADTLSTVTGGLPTLIRPPKVNVHRQGIEKWRPSDVLAR